MDDSNITPGPPADLPVVQGFALPWLLNAGDGAKAAERPCVDVDIIAPPADDAPRGGSPVTVEDARAPAPRQLSPQETFKAREETHPALPVLIRPGKPGPPRDAWRAREYVTQNKTTGGNRSNFDVLKLNEAMIKGLFARVFWSLDHAYIIECLQATDMIVTAENVDEVVGDVMRECLLFAERGERAPSRPGATGPVETGVGAMAFVRFLAVGVGSYRRYTADEYKKALDILAQGHVETLASTRRMALYNVPGAPGNRRLEAYATSNPVRLALIAAIKRELDTPNSLAAKAMPAELVTVNGRGNNTPAVVAAPEVVPGDRVMYVSHISCSGGSRGAGGVVLRRLTALADSLGAFIILGAVPTDGLPYTFYADAGFQFVRHTVACSTDPEDYLLPLMMRAPDADRRKEAAAIPMPAMRPWGDAARRFLPTRTARTTPYPLGPFAAHVLTWDANKDCQARGLSLMRQDGVEDAVHLPRAPFVFSGLPAWGAKETRDYVSDAHARLLTARMGASAAAAAAAVKTDEEGVDEVGEQDCGARPVPATWQPVPAAGKRRREDATAEPPAQRSRRPAAVEEAEEPRAMHIRTDLSVVAAAVEAEEPRALQRRVVYDCHLLVKMLSTFMENSAVVAATLVELRTWLDYSLSPADLNVVTEVAIRHPSLKEVAGDIVLACLVGPALRR